MAFDIESANVNLDTIFEPYHSPDTQAAATGIESAGVDLNARYESIEYGQEAATTGIESGYTDLKLIFCKIGTRLTVTLPSFPNHFTSSPQPASGSAPMAATITGGPGGTYTYYWTSDVISGTGAFFIDSGQGTDTIEWHATSTGEEPTHIRVTCSVTANLTGATGAGTTQLNWDIF